ncbi:MAG: efflux RND transporter permease subunit [Bacteroidia bacterium]|nr:efflux RND transporter permease subunit [Bacteroidia bacterium]
MSLGIAGGIAKAFINSKLTILLMVGLMALGVISAWLTPREEEPQIDVPIANIFLGYPGATPAEVEQRVIAPLERILMNITGVEYVYSTALPGQAMFIVRYEVGLNVEASMVKLYEQVLKNLDKMPPGVTPPLIKVRGIDDVPAVSYTLWSETYDDAQLRQMAQELVAEIKAVPDVADVTVLGGRSEQVAVRLRPDRMAALGIDALHLVQQLQAANQQLHAGAFTANNVAYAVRSGDFLATSSEVADLIVGVNQGQPVYLRQVAEVTLRPEEPTQYVGFGYGKASGKPYGAIYPAVTLAIAKRQGTDAMRLSTKIEAKLEQVRGSLLPAEVHLETTRNYGETAAEKVSELLMHLFWAVVSVTVLVTLSMGWRGGLVVFLSLPVTFALTLFAYYVLDYTLNRITLFALVFVTGIIVDDSIIVAENMHRHFKQRRLPPLQAALAAISEVGNPTILATLTVIVAVLPMVAVSGLMGPYMSPMPIGASFAMLFSLFAALIFTPWLAYRLMGSHGHGEAHAEQKPHSLEQSWIYRLYQRILGPMLDKAWLRWSFLGFTTLLLLASMLLMVFRVVPLKMLPFDNKNEFQVLIDMPESSTLEATYAVTRELAAYLDDHPEVMSLQTYVGNSAPITFNGLVRHYDLRRQHHMADIQVVLTPKHHRSVQSHAIAKAIRPDLQAIGQRYGANVKLIEVPPGPPVMSTLVAEIYGPDDAERLRIAQGVAEALRQTEGVVDVDIQTEDDQVEYQLVVDKEKAALHGVSAQQVVQASYLALSGQDVTLISSETRREPLAVNVRLHANDRSSVHDLGQLRVGSQRGYLVPVADLVTVREAKRPRSITRKNQQRVVYVLADVAGRLESPAYAMVDADALLQHVALPAGYQLTQEWTGQPTHSEEYILKWDGEWQITYEVFRDLGGAFGLALIGIYVLIVGWFQNFRTPFIMMISIPLSLIGILVAHWWAGAFFTATSMIGMIALAGIMVRNGVLLIDFVNLRLAEGTPLKQALIEAGAVRTTPIILTAGAVIVGAFVILFDPIFQGLALAFLGGSVAATLLTLVVVPIVFYITERKKYETQPQTTH